MKNKINEGSGLWLDLRVDNPENPSCFWNSVRTSSFLDKKGKISGSILQKKSSEKDSFSLSGLSVGCQGPSTEIARVWVRVLGSGRHRSWRCPMQATGQCRNPLERAKGRRASKCPMAAGEEPSWLLSESAAPTQHCSSCRCFTRPPQPKMGSRLRFAPLK